MKIQVPNCGLPRCGNEGLWKPVVEVFRNDGKVATAELEIRICTIHKTVLALSDFMPLVWNIVEEGFKVKHLEPPNRDLAVLKWERWNPEIIVLET